MMQKTGSDSSEALRCSRCGAVSPVVYWMGPQQYLCESCAVLRPAALTAEPAAYSISPIFQPPATTTQSTLAGR